GSRMKMNHYEWKNQDKWGSSPLAGYRLSEDQLTMQVLIVKSFHNIFHKTPNRIMIAFLNTPKH
ncbi:hypothetical protein P6709_19870, partial [Jeotgalibacillus sp. ET6]|uniref:hypothetical protein n=1 Tax=Jeotgalibacillus sp. ET6 TaxID=3037260 RepID=UPI00241818CF